VTCRCIAEKSNPLQSQGESFPRVTMLAFEKHLPWLLTLGGVGRVHTVGPHLSRDCLGCKYELCANDLMCAPWTA